MMIPKRYNVKEYDSDVHKCIRCGDCVTICPVYDFLEWESESPRGRMQLIKRLNDKEIQYNDVIKDRMFECTLCGYCKFKCPANVRTVDAIRSARVLLVEKNLIPDAVGAMSRAVVESKNIFNNPPETRYDWINYLGLNGYVKSKNKASVVYFAGCSTILSGRAMSIAAATTSILNAMNYDWTFMGTDEWCCGNPLLAAGQLKDVEKIAKHNIETIKRKGADTVVTSCPGCYRVLADEYIDIIGDHGLTIKHITHVIEEGINNNKFEFKNKIHKTVTYHDPCELGRLMDVFEPPRKALENIPGLKFNELNRTKNFTYCCGAGGLMKATFSDMALKMGLRKIEESHEVGAEVLVSACQTCKLMFLDSILEKRDTLKTVDIAELIAKAIGAKEMENPRARRSINFL